MTRTVPTRIWLEGPITDVDELARLATSGDACVDDVGTVRMLRYGNSHMGGGWTHRGDNPLTFDELTEKGTRPVWLIRIEMSDPGEIEPGCWVLAQLSAGRPPMPAAFRVETVDPEAGTALLAGAGHFKLEGLTRIPAPPADAPVAAFNPHAVALDAAPDPAR